MFCRHCLLVRVEGLVNAEEGARVWIVGEGKKGMVVY